MASDGVPEEYMDVLFQEFAYDPIRLSHLEDPSQMLYNRRTLETIWETKHHAINPFTRQPFHIECAIPQTELREEMHQYIAKTRIPGLQVIPDYTKVLTAREMICLFKDLVNHHRYLSEKNEEKEEADWRLLWQKLNLIRLCCQYSPENRAMFSSIRGYHYLFMVVDAQLESYYSSSDEAKEVCREVARIAAVVGLIGSDLMAIPEKSVQAFLNILFHLGQSKYLKIHSMVLNIYCQIFYYNITFPLLNTETRFFHRVIEIALKLLGRRNSREKITDEDLHNGTAILTYAWKWKRLALLEFQNYVQVLEKVVILCISRYPEHLVSSRQEEAIRGVLYIGKALNLAFQLIEFLLKAEDSEVYQYGHQKMRLEDLDIVKDIVGMVKLVLAGFNFEPSHVRSGLVITKELLKTGRRKMSEDEIKVFADFIGSGILKKYPTDGRELLEDIIMMNMMVVNID